MGADIGRDIPASAVRSGAVRPASTCSNMRRFDVTLSRSHGWAERFDPPHHPGERVDPWGSEWHADRPAQRPHGAPVTREPGGVWGFLGGSGANAHRLPSCSSHGPCCRPPLSRRLRNAPSRRPPSAAPRFASVPRRPTWGLAQPEGQVSVPTKILSLRHRLRPRASLPVSAGREPPARTVEFLELASPVERPVEPSFLPSPTRSDRSLTRFPRTVSRRRVRSERGQERHQRVARAARPPTDTDIDHDHPEHC